jgi:hypothetical protein
MWSRDAGNTGTIRNDKLARLFQIEHPPYNADESDCSLLYSLGRILLAKVPTGVE